MEKDLTKTPLIELVAGLTEIDNRINEYLLKKDKIDDSIEAIKSDYNNIIKEIHRRFPPLVDDVNLQPKVMRK